MNAIRCPSPAKINLFLHILGRRSDGYHELQTLFQFVDLNDWLTFTINASGTIQLTGDTAGVTAENNLVFKAANALKEYAVDEAGVEIKLEKNIPSGAGLGGGSSNAATTLLMLNELWQLQLSIEELSQIGLSLGADVPIFIKGHAAFATGVGENLIPAELPLPTILLAMPKETSISTKTIFTAEDLPRNSVKIDIKNYHFSITQNDCENIVKRHYPSVANTLAWLLEYAPSRMTGTGACCFAIINDEKHAFALAEQAPDFVDCYVTQANNISSAREYISKNFTSSMWNN